jgi:hypothetical protein
MQHYFPVDPSLQLVSLKCCSIAKLMSKLPGPIVGHLNPSVSKALKQTLANKLITKD